MWDSVPARILVAVESADCEAQLQYAAAEAVRRGCGIHLVHVARPALVESCALNDIALLEEKVRSDSDANLSRAARRLHDILGDSTLPISVELTHGLTVHALVSLSAHASLVVLQHDRRGEPAGSARLSVSPRVCARAQCPVVTVPRGWLPEPEHRAVVVGVDDPHRTREVVRTAQEEAARRSARLLMVQAWTHEPGSSPQAVAAESERRHDLLSELLGELLVSETDHQADHVVRVDRVVTTGPPGDELLAASSEADLIVIGRHDDPHSVEPCVSATARELLSRSRVPVMVVDPLPRDPVTAGSSAATVAMPYPFP